MMVGGLRRLDIGNINGPMAYKGSGFCPDYVPTNPKIAMLLEAPGENEILDHSPLVGKAGKFWTKRLIEVLGYTREDVLISNCGRCRPGSDNQFPTGFLRKQVLECCRHYDTKHGAADGSLLKGGISQFAPNFYIVSYHPASILRTPALYRPTLRAVEFAFQKYKEGYRPCVLMGGVATSLVAPELGKEPNLKRWQRHYFERSGWIV